MFRLHIQNWTSITIKLCSNYFWQHFEPPLQDACWNSILSLEAFSLIIILWPFDFFLILFACQGLLGCPEKHVHSISVAFGSLYRTYASRNTISNKELKFKKGLPNTWDFHHYWSREDQIYTAFNLLAPQVEMLVSCFKPLWYPSHNGATLKPKIRKKEKGT